MIANYLPMESVTQTRKTHKWLREKQIMSEMEIKNEEEKFQYQTKYK